MNYSNYKKALKVTVLPENRRVIASDVLLFNKCITPKMRKMVGYQNMQIICQRMIKKGQLDFSLNIPFTAIAICSPEDEFDAEKGKVIALARLNYMMAKKRKLIIEAFLYHYKNIVLLDKISVFENILNKAWDNQTGCAEKLGRLS